MTENMDKTENPQTDPFKVIQDVWEGNIGLPITYWAYGILGGIVWAVCIKSIDPEPDGDLIKILYLLVGVYYIVVYTGIWRSSEKYTGNRMWAILAKFAVIISALPTVITLFKWMTKSDY